jgi:hypothetical protein
MRDADAGTDMRRCPGPAGHSEVVDRIAEEGVGLGAARGFRVSAGSHAVETVAAIVELALEPPRPVLDTDPGADIEALGVVVAFGGAAILEMRHRIDRAEMRPSRLAAGIEPVGRGQRRCHIQRAAGRRSFRAGWAGLLRFLELSYAVFHGLFKRVEFGDLGQFLATDLFPSLF